MGLNRKEKLERYFLSVINGQRPGHGADFLRAVKTAFIFARDGSGIVRIVMAPGEKTAPGKVSVSARSEEIGDYVGELDAIVEGEGVKIAFDGKYPIEVFSKLNEEQVALEVTSPTSPSVLKLVGDENYVHVLMPMFVG